MIYVSVAIGMIRQQQALSPISLDCLLTLIICETFRLGKLADAWASIDSPRGKSNDKCCQLDFC